LFRATRSTAAPATPLKADLDGIALTGAGVNPPQAAPGSDVIVTLFWQPTRSPAQNYTSFVHLLDAAGHRLAQSDHQPGGDFYPSRLWQPGETLRDSHTLRLPDPLPAGQYRLMAGLYHQPHPGEFENLGDAVEIGTISVD
jgi:hypothetical protein